MRILAAHRNVSVLATGDYQTDAHASAGASNDEAVAAAVAAVISNNNTIANVRPSTALSSITGNLVVSADQVSNATHSANANSTAADVGAGAAISLALIQGGAQAFAGNSMNVNGTVSINANTQTFMDADCHRQRGGNGQRQ